MHRNNMGSITPVATHPKLVSFPKKAILNGIFGIQ